MTSIEINKKVRDLQEQIKRVKKGWKKEALQEQVKELIMMKRDAGKIWQENLKGERE